MRCDRYAYDECSALARAQSAAMLRRHEHLLRREALITLAIVSVSVLGGVLCALRSRRRGRAPAQSLGWIAWSGVLVGVVVSALVVLVWRAFFTRSTLDTLRDEADASAGGYGTFWPGVAALSSAADAAQ